MREPSEESKTSNKRHKHDIIEYNTVFDTLLPWGDAEESEAEELEMSFEKEPNLK
jgi:hypothetical protein